jgi:hypothetical protein
MKPIPMIFLFIIYVASGIAFGISIGLQQRQKTVKPDYVSDSLYIELLDPQRVEEIVFDDGSTITVPEGVTRIIIQGVKKINESKDDNPFTLENKDIVYPIIVGGSVIMKTVESRNKVD